MLGGSIFISISNIAALLMALAPFKAGRLDLLDHQVLLEDCQSRALSANFKDKKGLEGFDWVFKSVWYILPKAQVNFEMKNTNGFG